MTLDEIIAFAGGVTKLAAAAGVDHSTVSKSWRSTGKVPVSRARRIAEELGLRLCDLRPDVWPMPEFKDPSVQAIADAIRALSK